MATAYFTARRGHELEHRRHTQTHACRRPLWTASSCPPFCSPLTDRIRDGDRDRQRRSRGVVPVSDSQHVSGVTPCINEYQSALVFNCYYQETRQIFYEVTSAHVASFPEGLIVVTNKIFLERSGSPAFYEAWLERRTYVRNEGPRGDKYYMPCMHTATNQQEMIE